MSLSMVLKPGLPSWKPESPFLAPVGKKTSLGFHEGEGEGNLPSVLFCILIFKLYGFYISIEVTEPCFVFHN